jgi:hypothetical protein
MTKLKAETELRRCTFVERPPVLEEVEEQSNNENGAEHPAPADPKSAARGPVR